MKQSCLKNTFHEDFGGFREAIDGGIEEVSTTLRDDLASLPSRYRNHGIAVFLFMNASASSVMMSFRQPSRCCSSRPMRGGKEHRVPFLPDEERVIKDADVRALATDSPCD